MPPWCVSQRGGVPVAVGGWRDAQPVCPWICVGERRFRLVGYQEGWGAGREAGLVFRGRPGGWVSAILIFGRPGGTGLGAKIAVLGRSRSYLSANTPRRRSCPP